MARGTYRYADPADVAELEPRASVATAWTTPPAAGPGGVVKLNESGVRLLIVGATPLKASVVPVAKSDPATVTI